MPIYKYTYVFWEKNIQTAVNKRKRIIKLSIIVPPIRNKKKIKK